MKNIITISIVICAFVFLLSCAELAQVMEDLDQPLTNREVVDGLREALRIGIDIAAGQLSKSDGYYGDELVKILLPPEADIITDNLHRIPGGTKLLEDVLLRINRSAENAAKEVVPVFVNAIAGMTIQDGFVILRGGNDAATQYFRKNTFNELFSLYQPKIRKSLDQKLVGGISTNESWDKLTRQWNRLAGSPAGQLTGLKSVDIKLDEYLTNKALDGLFLKLAVEEGKIRNDPRARITALLERVFGSRDAQR